MKALQQINCKFETSLAYYEMCAEDAMFDYYTESEGDPSKDSAATKSIWARIKEIVAKIFKSLGEALGKIGDKIKGSLGGQSINDLVTECNKLYDSVGDDAGNEMIEVRNVNELATLGMKYSVKIARMLIKIKIHREVAKDDVTALKESYAKEKAEIPETAKYTLKNLIDTMPEIYATAMSNRRKMDIDWANSVASSSKDTTNVDSIPALASFEAEIIKDMETWKSIAVANLIKIRNKMKSMSKHELTADTHATIQARRDAIEYMRDMQANARIRQAMFNNY